MNNKISYGSGIGLIVGVIIGSKTNNIGFWLPLFLCFGAGVGLIFNEKKKKQHKIK